jgi:hypothetical protein
VFKLVDLRFAKTCIGQLRQTFFTRELLFTHFIVNSAEFAELFCLFRQQPIIFVLTTLYILTTGSSHRAPLTKGTELNVILLRDERLRHTAMI